jgi:hypothetical protein
VPDNKAFTFDVSTNADLQLGPVLLADNLSPGVYYFTSSTATIPMQADACAATNSCTTAAMLESAFPLFGSVANSCVTIPGVNN